MSLFGVTTAVSCQVNTRGSLASWLNGALNCPLFRSIAPSTSPSRMLPKLSNLLSNTAVRFIIALGVSVIGSAALLVMRFAPRAKIDAPGSFALTGLLAGLMGGLFSTAGPPLVYKLYRQPLSLPVIRQALLVMFGLSQLVRLGLVLITGQFTPASVAYAVLAVPLVFLVTRYNRRYPPKLSVMAVSRVAAGLLFMAGASLIATSW